MNRRTRHARRQLPRGDAHPEPLLLVTDDRADLIAAMGLIGRIGYRYRSELLPPAVAGALAVAAAILRDHRVAPWC